MILLLTPLEKITWITLFSVFASFLTFESLRTFVFQGVLSIAHQRSKLFQKKRIYRIPWKDSQILSEVFATLRIVPFDALFVVAFAWLNLFKPAEGTVFLTFALTFVWFEIWFYVTHRLFHTKRFYFLHAQHHVAKVTSPWTAMSFSLLERTILLIGGFGVPMVLSWFLPLTPLGFALYFPVNYLLNLYGHLNVELIPAKWLQKPGGQIFNTTTYHALHHARYQGHYGLFTPFLDRMFRTSFADYELVQKECSEGRGLESLGQRLTPSQKGNVS